MTDYLSLTDLIDNVEQVTNAAVEAFKLRSREVAVAAV